MSDAKPKLKTDTLIALASIRAWELRGVYMRIFESPWKRSHLKTLSLAAFINLETGRIRTTDSGVAHIAANIDAICAGPARRDALEGGNEVAAIKASLGLAEDVAEPIYSAAPALAMDPNKLPVLRRGTATAPGQAYWILGDGTVDDFATAFDAGMTDNQPVAAQSTPGSNTFIVDLSLRVQLHGTSGMPASDVWLAVLGKDQAKYSVGALKELLMLMRSRLPSQRIIWVLAKSAPAGIAKALGEAGEEWFRSSHDLPTRIAIDAIRVVQVDSADHYANALAGSTEEATRADDSPASAIQKMLDAARAEGMGEALEIAKREACVDTEVIWRIRWDNAEEAIAERQAALRGPT